MAQQNDNGFISLEAAVDLEEYRGVILTAAGKATYPDAVGERIIGITQGRAAAGENITIKMINAPGTFKIQLGNDACDAVEFGDPLYLAAANGLFVDTDPGSGTIWFHAMEACEASGIVECYPIRA